MRGDDREPEAMFSYVSMETRIPQDHPLRAMRSLVDGCLREMSPRFALLYARTGRPSIAPEKLLRAQLLQVLYTIRSEARGVLVRSDLPKVAPEQLPGWPRLWQATRLSEKVEARGPSPGLLVTAAVRDPR